LQAGCRRFDPDQLHKFSKGLRPREAFFDKCIRRQNQRFLLSLREVLKLTPKGEGNAVRRAFSRESAPSDSFGLAAKSGGLDLGLEFRQSRREVGVKTRDQGK
jgi:hypothetical protein